MYVLFFLLHVHSQMDTSSTKRCSYGIGKKMHYCIIIIPIIKNKKYYKVNIGEIGGLK